MKKWISTAVIATLIAASIPPVVSHAAATIQIYIDNERLSAPQPPVMQGARVLIPLRSIFEGLDAKVVWNNQTKTVTATKGDQMVSLKLGSKAANINGSTVYLDVPASVIKGNTMVPIRFVTEALGEEVYWNSQSKRVDIVTKSDDLSSSTVTTKVGTQYGDGRDIKVEFTPSQNEGGVYEYRVMLVKDTNAGNFTLNAAMNTTSANYTQVSKRNGTASVTLGENTRDVSGEKIRTGVTYKVYVLTVGNDASDYASVLSSARDSITLTAKPAVQAATELRTRDIANNGDGRDIEISFKQPGTTSDISSYRAFIVKTKDAASFDLNAANRASSSYSTVISKSGSSVVTTTLTSSSRDVSGDLIRNGTAYTLFILSTSTNTNDKQNKLSSGSSSFTLDGSTLTAPSITSVTDRSDYGDARDLQISFNKTGDESKVGFYRIFVVRNNNSSAFTMNDANRVSNGSYYDVSKNGKNQTITLPQNLKDTSGYTVREGESYRIFVASMGNQQGGYGNLLSAPSALINLNNNSVTKPVSSVAVNDIQDYGDGRDLQVTFNKSSEESRVDHYRVYVVKSGNAGSFDLSRANGLGSDRYTRVNKTGGNLSVTLASGARDTDGAAIRSGVSYRVFVLAVSNGGDSKLNALSSASSTIQLSASSVRPVSSVSASIKGNVGDGRDVTISFQKASDETGIARYLIMLVRADEASRFDLSAANRVASNNYTAVGKKGTDISQVLTENTKDINGNKLASGTSYKAFVLSLADGSSRSVNALSDASGSFVLNQPSVQVDQAYITKVENKPDVNPALQVNFNKAGDEKGLSFYAVIAVKAAAADQFTLEQANALPRSQYTAVSRSGRNESVTVDTYTLDSDGSSLKPGVAYRFFILSVADGEKATINNLSRASDTIVLEDISPKKEEKKEDTK
ncbi:stalk domain-containing protein [Paenibacillus sp. Marseille-Q4541]|uniref:stalk domain-containing protein n=1 Tax=Paenibacillus sp. Marseille-Q4541 TaxID=2831522 RepID=UPI001BAAD625|nr:stalk domain-containing protein [Paenibacillus sp. Marseille-Q4541]